jgi:RNA polymerase sigma-54 factor
MGIIGLELRTRQQLALTPRLQQSVKLLQLSAQEFEQALRLAVGSNPFLDDDLHPGETSASEGTAPSAATESTESPADIDTASFAESKATDLSLEEGFADRFESGSHSDRMYLNQESEDGDWTDWTDTGTTLHEHLHEQARSLRLNPRDELLLYVLIEALDDDGYLRQDPTELTAVSGLDPAPGAEEFGTPLKLLQSLEPTGVGARSLAECLTLQLNGLPSSPATELAKTIATRHLESLGRREFARLQHALGCTEPALRAAHSTILRLNPRPGNQFSRSDLHYVVPDVIVRRIRGNWVPIINPAVMPNIRINRRYAEIFRRARDSSHPQLAQQLQEARWLVRNSEQRFTTILRVAEAIVIRQKNFFEYGDVAMKPLGLRHIADELELHESTISRATGNKYMSTPRGMLEFRHFFSRQLETDTGGTCSATAIRALLREMITTEDHNAPLSDVRLAELLAAQGIKVARRTVTKYRRLMQVPPVELRRLGLHSSRQTRAATL